MRVNQAGNQSTVQGNESTAANKADKTSRAQSANKNAEKNAKNYGATLDQSTAAELSPRGKEMARARALASSTPDVREEKIAALKKRIAEGKYKVNEEAVADRLVDEHLRTQGMD